MITPNSSTSHSAVGPALGYYYQAVYAVLLLLNSEEDHAYISIESLDDVELNQRGVTELHQLKHSVNPKSKISISSRELWSTLKVWCDFLIDNPDSEGTFFLVTVANIAESSELNTLLDDAQPRDSLVSALEVEANRIQSARLSADEGRKQDIAEGKEPRSLPYNDKFKGCEAFLSLPVGSRKSLINKVRLESGSFPISEGVPMIENAIKKTVPHEIRQKLAKQTLAWWEREVIESLTHERVRQIYASEIKQKICELSAQLMEDGLTDNSEIIIPPNNLSIDKRLRFQLDLIGATEKIIQRSAKSEWRARTQRSIWTDGDLSLPKKIDSYDDVLVEEWQDQFDEAISSINTDDDQSKIEVGKNLLSWSHFEAHKELKPIRPHWTDPNLVRGSYQILSIERRVGWHPDYYDLTSKDTGDK